MPALTILGHRYPPSRSCFESEYYDGISDTNFQFRVAFRDDIATADLSNRPPRLEDVDMT